MNVYMVLNGDAYDNVVLALHATREGAEAHAALDPEWSWVEEWQVRA